MPCQVAPSSDPLLGVILRCCRLRRWFLALAFMACGTPCAVARAQLVSPGGLSTAHASLEGLTHCRDCHRLGVRGADRQRCLDCHRPLARRIVAGTGLHASFRDPACAECHREHFGAGFALVRFDTATFDHARTGFTLRQAHDTLACSRCHRPALIAAADVRQYLARNPEARSYLGLGAGCPSCHARDDPHGRQFRSRRCDQCHDEGRWADFSRFDHSRTRYPLTGEHVTVPCSQCHFHQRRGDPRSPIRNVGLAFARCTACHAAGFR